MNKLRTLSILIVALFAGALFTSTAHAAEAELVTPKLVKFSKEPAVEEIKALTAKIKDKEKASAKQLNGFEKDKTKSFDAVNKAVAARDTARKDNLTPWLKSYKERLMAPVEQTYSQGLAAATQEYNKAVKAAKKTQANAEDAAREQYNKDRKVAYKASDKELKEARKEARYAAKQRCKKSTKAGSSARNKCIAKAKKTQISSIRRNQILNRLDSKLEVLRDQRDAKIASAEATFESAEKSAADALRKKQDKLLAAFDKAKAQVEKDVDATKAANLEYYKYLNEREVKKATGLKDDLRDALDALKKRSEEN